MTSKDGFLIEAFVGESVVPFDTADIEQAQAAIAEFAIAYPGAAVRAVNASMAGTKTDMKALMRSTYKFKASVISGRIKVHKAKVKATKGYIESKGKEINLTDISGTRSLKGGVKASLKKGGKGSLIPSAFIQKVESGKEVVLRRPSVLGGIRYPRYGARGSGGLVTVKGRKTAGRARLEWFMTMHPEFLYNTKENWQKLGAAIKVRVDTNIQRETDAELRKLEGKW